MPVITPAQVRAYQSLEDRYPEHLPPILVTDNLGVTALVFLIREHEMDCGGCGQEHVEYLPILPDGTVLDNPLTGGPFVSHSVGENMILGLCPLDMGERREVEVEDWPRLDSDFESDPWLGLDS